MLSFKHLTYLIFIFFIACTTPSDPEVIDISNQELILLMTNPDLQLVDVRTPGEVESGKIEGALNIDFKDPNFQATIDNLDKKKPIVVYCGSGGRSGNTSDLLLELGFNEIYDLTGGFSKWEEEKLPVSLPE